VTPIRSATGAVAYEFWPEGNLLRRFEIVWSDGKESIVHAKDLSDAKALAEGLGVPEGVVIRRVFEVT
jgi:hypothetical protein